MVPSVPRFTVSVSVVKMLITAPVDKIISGGQTGADRGGLKAAITLGIPHGGWCPKGRRAEDGTVPVCYQLQETAGRNYQTRTVRNVHDADGTVIFACGALEGGTLLTARVAGEAGKPCLHLDLEEVRISPEATAVRLRSWLTAHRIRTLNVAGPRESQARGIEAAVARFLDGALRNDQPASAYAVEDERVLTDAPYLAAAEAPPSYSRAGDRKGRRQRRRS